MYNIYVVFLKKTNPIKSDKKNKKDLKLTTGDGVRYVFISESLN